MSIELGGTKTKEQIIHDMCFTMRHDYGLRISPEDAERCPISAGMTDYAAKALYNEMRQVYENCIEPHMVIKEGPV